jgi:hypothetical protein
VRFFVAILLTALALPAAAGAATVRSEPSPSRYYPPKMTFEAAPGEVNHLVLSGGPTARSVIDETAPLVAGDGCRQVNDHEAVCGNAYDVHVDLGDRDDHASFEATSADGAFVLAGPGDDVLAGGPGSESFDGGDGRDTISGGAGHDDVEGDDETPFADRLDGGPGNDSLGYRTHRVGVRVDLSDPSAPAGAEGEGDQQSGFEEVFAGRGGPSELIGDDGPNFLAAEAPGSRIDGRGGSDYVHAVGSGTGEGGAGDDRIVSHPGGSAECGDGADVVWGGVGGYRSPAGDWFSSAFGLVAPDCERLRVQFSNASDSEPRPHPALSGRHAKFRVPCPRDLEARRCTGRVRLRDTRGRELGVRRFATRRGRSPVVGVPLSDKTRRRIARPAGLDVVVFILVAGGRERADATYTVTLRQP